MGRPRRGFLRLALVAAAAGAAWFAFVAWSDRLPPAAALPGGAAAAFEARDLAGLVARVEGTRFAAALEKSALRSRVEASEAVRALDALLAEVRSITRLPVGRRHLLDVVGREVAVAWYPASDAGGARWVGASRLTTRAWALARLLLLAERAGIADGAVTRETIAGSTVLAIPGGDRHWHAFLVGRLLVLGDDRGLVQRAARAAGGDEPALAQDPSWSGLRRELPEGEAYVWTRGGTSLDPFTGAGARAPLPGAAASIRTGRRTEIHVLAEPTAEGKAASPGPRADELPPLGRLAREPLLLHASRGLPPPLLEGVLESRRRAVATRAGLPVASPSPAAPGFLVAVTGATDAGALPQPRGVVVLTAPSAREAGEGIEALFPPTARTASVAGVTARSTRESIPLSGEVEVWGAAIGPRIVLATGLEEIAALAAPDEPRLRPPAPGWEVESVTVVSGTRTLPLLRPYAPFLGGLVAARTGGPNPARDVELLAAVRSATLLAGEDRSGRRGLLALELADLPAAPSTIRANARIQQ